MIRLNQHLRTLGLTNAQLKAALSTGKVSYCGVPTSDPGRLVDPDWVVFNQSAPRLSPGRDLAIVHRDKDLVVVWKPSGLLSVPARKEGGHISVESTVRRMFGTAHTVHRIDEQTSGIMLVALNELSQKHLKDQLFKHTMGRRYLAIVAGKPRRQNWTVESTLIRNRGDGLRGSSDLSDDPNGYHSKTHFRLLEHLGKAAVVEATLETGRTHQVRIHLSEGRHAILGDPLYANPTVKRLAPRLALHAASLSFIHPGTGEKLAFNTPLADDLEKVRRTHLRRGGEGITRRKKRQR